MKVSYIYIFIGLYFTVLFISICTGVRQDKEIDIDTTIKTKDDKTFTYTYEYENKIYGPYKENIDKLIDGKYKIRLPSNPDGNIAMLISFLIFPFLLAVFFLSLGYYHLKTDM